MYQRILVPFDGSPTSTRGLDEAIRLAALTHGRLRLVHMVDELLCLTGFESYAVYANDILPLMRDAGEKILQAGRERVDQAGVTVDTLLLESAVPRLADLVADQVKSWGADLVVIGTHGRRGVGRWFLGSDAEQVVRTSPVPVLLVRAQEAATVAEAAAAAEVEKPESGGANIRCATACNGHCAAKGAAKVGPSVTNSP